MKIMNSRAYGGIYTPSDHKMVIMKFIAKWPYSNNKKQPPQIDIGKLHCAEIRKEYEDVLRSVKINQKHPKLN